LTISINGTSIGDLKSYDLTCPNYVAEPETPQATPIPAYRAGRANDKLTIGITGVLATTFFSTMATLKGYVDDEEAVYLADSTFNIYDGAKATWIVLNEVRGSITDGKSLGEITLTGTVTTDSTDSTYTPA
jgi:hypothetical protein